MNNTDIEAQILAVLHANPRRFVSRITQAARSDISAYHGHVLLHIKEFHDMPCAVDMLMETFFRDTNTASVINYVLSDPTFVRDWFPRYIREFSTFLRPHQKSAVLEAMAMADATIRMKCWPASSFLLQPEEWTSELAAGAALGPTVAAIPAEFLTPELLASHTAFDDLCAILLIPCDEQKKVVAFLREHANYLFSKFTKSRLRLQYLPFLEGYVLPSIVTKIMRETNPSHPKWNFLDGTHPIYNRCQWWPLGKLPKLNGYYSVGRFQILMNELDWLVLPFFSKKNLNVDVMGHVASFLFINDFASRVRIFFRNSPALVTAYLERCIRPAARVKRIKV